MDKDIFSGIVGIFQFITLVWVSLFLPAAPIVLKFFAFIGLVGCLMIAAYDMRK